MRCFLKKLLRQNISFHPQRHHLNFIQKYLLAKTGAHKCCNLKQLILSTCAVKRANAEMHYFRV